MDGNPIRRRADRLGQCFTPGIMSPIPDAYPIDGAEHNGLLLKK